MDKQSRKQILREKLLVEVQTLDLSNWMQTSSGTGIEYTISGGSSITGQSGEAYFTVTETATDGIFTVTFIDESSWSNGAHPVRNATVQISAQSDLGGSIETTTVSLQGQSFFTELNQVNDGNQIDNVGLDFGTVNVGDGVIG